MRRTDPEIERQVMELYAQGLSYRKIAEKLRIGFSTVRNILARNSQPRRSISEANMKYPKTAFSGDREEHARIIGFMEDCAASHHHKQIRVQTSPTHPAQIRTFGDNFGRYGHIGLTPGYIKRDHRYYWNVYIDLNSSFEFLIVYKGNPIAFLAETTDDVYEIVRIASLTDAEGWVGIDINEGYPRPNLSISNNNKQLLERAQGNIGGSIGRNNKGYKLQLTWRQAVEALRKLPIRHEEKTAAKEIILHHADKGGIGLEAVGEYRELRRKIDEEVRICTMQARLEFIAMHGKPHRYDPDQSIQRI